MNIVLCRGCNLANYVCVFMRACGVIAKFDKVWQLIHVNKLGELLPTAPVQRQQTLHYCPVRVMEPGTSWGAHMRRCRRAGVPAGGKRVLVVKRDITI